MTRRGGVNENTTHIVDGVLSSSAPSSPDGVSTGLDSVDYSYGNQFDWTNGEISVGSLNVCGLKSKEHCPEFVQLVNKFTILCVVETKLDVHDSINVQNFTFFSKPRSQKVKKKSGGIGFFVHSSISNSR